MNRVLKKISRDFNILSTTRKLILLAFITKYTFLLIVIKVIISNKYYLYINSREKEK